MPLRVLAPRAGALATENNLDRGAQGSKTRTPMSLALRYGACGSFFLAAILLGAALFLPVESITSVPSKPATAYATAWTIDGGLPAANNTVTKGGTWYDPSFAHAEGKWMLRLAGPMLLLGMLTILVCGFLVLSGRGVATGWTGTAGLMVAGAGALLLLIGIPRFAKTVTSPLNMVLDTGIHPEVGFWSMFIGILLGSGAALAAFSVKLEPKGRIGPDGEPLPPLPVLSVENPNAFNPMANRDPRPFRQEEHPYKSFEVTGGRKTFKSEAKKDDGEEGWEEPAAPAKSAAPATPPAAAKPGASKPAGGTSNPATGAAAAPPKTGAPKPKA